MKALVPLLALPLILAGCATVPTRIGDNGFAHLGETTRVGPASVQVDSVVEDSRCPADKQCIWAGRVRINVTVHDNTRDQTRTLTLGEPALLATGEIVLDSVDPPTRTDAAIAARDYRFHFSWRDR